MSAGEFLLDQTEDGRTRVECRFADETLWLSQAGMAALFQTSKQNVAKHLKAVFGEGELDADSVVNQWLTTAADGKAYRVAHYKLEAIFAVEMADAHALRSRRACALRKALINTGNRNHPPCSPSTTSTTRARSARSGCSKNSACPTRSSTTSAIRRPCWRPLRCGPCIRSASRRW
ncbi:hypothetical protein VAPA_1c47780 [Variovorax paradoxus B4]|uniref:Uncharacterized protein n=1 Tax=Variovorax paradoxus B4 TaxID=1246301 RepID=T1XHL9_VARPD|nr:hypothetical protein VAPA_1c47780 [Variovorax paradoxus B4]